MLFQYFSDIHLEFYKNPSKIDKINVERKAPYLIIAGDIDNIAGLKGNRFERFVKRMSLLFDYVFIVSGNHDYYRSKQESLPIKEWFQMIDDKIRKIIKPMCNVVFLQNEVFLLPNTDIAIFGSTLWTEVLPQEIACVRNQLSDYTCIPNMTVEFGIATHRASVASLEFELNLHKDKRFIVITHHLPTTKLIAKRYYDSGYNSAFASDVALSANPQIISWFAGHTHLQIEYEKFHVNPIGYPDAIQNRMVEYNKVIDVN
jgi:predicted phosphodiesterase